MANPVPLDHARRVTRAVMHHRDRQ